MQGFKTWLWRAAGGLMLSLSLHATAASSAQLTQYFANTHDLQANFSQSVYSARGEQQSSGEVWLKQPGKFYWDYQAPERQKIISNGDAVYQYDLDLQQISVHSRKDLVGDVALKVLSGAVPLDTAFSITQVTGNALPQALAPYADDEVYRLTPKENKENYDAVWLVMAQGNVKAIMVDAGRGQQTVLSFSAVKRNAGIPDSRFEFTPPAGVDMIGDADS